MLYRSGAGLGSLGGVGMLESHDMRGAISFGPFRLFPAERLLEKGSTHVHLSQHLTVTQHVRGVLIQAPTDLCSVAHPSLVALTHAALIGDGHRAHQPSELCRMVEIGCGSRALTNVSCEGAVELGDIGRRSLKGR